MLSSCKVCTKAIDIEQYKDRLCSEECRKKMASEAKLEEIPLPEKCFVCGAQATFIRTFRNLRMPVCPDKNCKRAAAREYSRIQMYAYRHREEAGKECEALDCGFKIVEKYRSLNKEVTYYLCPNHRTLVSLGYCSLKDLGLSN